MSGAGDRHRAACATFTELVGLDAASRAERLRELREADEPLACEVAEMLAADCGAPMAMDQLRMTIAAAAESSSADVDPLLGTNVGGFRLERLIATGGMGRVYEAKQESPTRIVAIKLLDARFDSPAALARFRHEVEFMARLVHPGIAQIYEAGTERDRHGAMPWFAMELVPNAAPITMVASERGLSIEARLSLFLKICDAVHFGHGRGIIHRDLKPSNVLVDRLAAELNPKIIDFGIARSTNADVAIATQRTEFGQVVGTLQYMSPEQVAGDPDAMDVRTDTYALGLLLYELLSGRSAFDVSRLPVHEALRVLATSEPKPMSVAAPHLRGALSGDLETIVRKALARGPARRYGSAGEFAGDLRRFLSHQPISARPPSAVYTAILFSRRHRALVWGFVATIAMLILGLIGTGIGLARAQQSERAAEAARDAAEFDSYVANVMAAEAALRNRDVKLAGERLRAAPAAHRGWEWRHLTARVDRSLIKTKLPLRWARAIDMSPDGRLVALGDAEGQVIVLTVEDLSVRWRHAEAREVSSLQFAPDGSRLALASHSGEVRVVETTNWSTLHRARVERPQLVQFDENGQLLVAGGERRLRLWAIEGDGTAAERELPAQPTTKGNVWPLAWSPKGAVLAERDDDRVRIQRSEDGASIGELEVPSLSMGNWRYEASFSHDSSRLAIILGDRLVVRTSSTGAGVVHPLDRRAATAVAWGAGDAAVITGHQSGVITLRDPLTLQPRSELLGHEMHVTAIVASDEGPHGPCIVSVDSGGSVRVWSPEADDLVRHVTNRAWVYGLAFGPDGSWFVTSAGETPAGDPMVARFDTRTGHRVWAAEPAKGRHLSFAASVSSEGAIVVADGAPPQAAEVFDAVTGELMLQVAREKAPSAFADVRFRPGHREYFLNVAEGRALVDAASGRVLRLFPLASLNEHAESADGRRVALSRRPGTGFEVFDIERGTRIARVNTPATVWSLDFSPNGQYIAARLETGELCLWSTQTWELVRAWPDDGSGGNPIHFEPGGRLVGYVQGGVRVWDVERGRELVTLPMPAEPSSKIAVSAEGGWIGVGCTDGSVTLFDGADQ